MKRFIMILLVAAMALTMVACGKEATSTESSLPDDTITGSTPIDQSTPTDTETPDSSASDGAPTSSALSNKQDGTGGDGLRWVDNKYSDRLTSINKAWCDYVKEKTGVDIDTFMKSKEWVNALGVKSLSLMEIIDDLNITREKFEEVNNKHNETHQNTLSSFGTSTEERVFCELCFTEEEIDIIYSGDKKRIAEAFAFPYAVVADNWELYPLRWIIDNPAILYKEREISLDAIQKAVDKIIEDGLVSNADKEALLARIEEYKELL